MINRLIDKLTLNYNTLKNRTVFGILFCLSFLVRFPFFFRDYIDRDESTFILMAQSWVEGNLPYTELWDLKPPFAFLFFAILIYFFGKSFIAIRLAGSLIVAITAFYSYRIGESLSSKKVALWIGISCVALQSMFGSIQGVMSEHIGMVFLMPAIYIIISKKEWFWLGLAGILMGISSMVKLNMAYSILLIGLYLIYFFIKEKKLKSGFVSIVAYGVGIIGVAALSWLPYYLENLQDVWWKSVIIAPIDYAQASSSNFFKVMPTLVVISAFFYFLWKKKYLDFKNAKVQILLVAILGVLYSFFKVGRVNTHYLIQLYPLLIVFVGMFISKFYASFKFAIPKGFLLLLLLIPAESYLEYFRIIKHKIERGSFFNGEGITVPQYILQNNIDTDSILFLEYHIGYWLLNEKPPTKASTHPSNIGKPEMFAAFDNSRKTAMEELRFTMENIKPKVVVTRKNRLIFDAKRKDMNAYIDLYLSKHYQLHTTVDEAQIYMRLE